VDGKSINAIGAAAAIQVVQQYTIGAVIGRGETEGGVNRRGVERRSADVHGVVLHLLHYADFFLALVVLGHALDTEERIRWRAEPFTDNLHPVGVALLGIEGHPVAVAPREKLANVFTGHGDLLRLLGLVVVRGRLPAIAFGDGGCRPEPDRGSEDDTIIGGVVTGVLRGRVRCGSPADGAVEKPDVDPIERYLRGAVAIRIRMIAPALVRLLVEQPLRHVKRIVVGNHHPVATVVRAVRNIRIGYTIRILHEINEDRVADAHANAERALLVPVEPGRRCGTPLILG